MVRRISPSVAGLLALSAMTTTVQASETITYGYDARGRLVKVDRAGTVNNGRSSDISYDDADNRTNYTVTGASTTADLAISDASVTEGGDLVFTVTRSGITALAASASYASADGTAAAGSDYTATSGTVTFASGETSRTVIISTLDDANIEAAENMTVSLSGASAGASIVTATGTGAINDNEVAADLAIGAASIAEGGTLQFTVTRSGNTSVAASANYASSDGTAAAVSDYVAGSGTVSFAIGETSKTIAVATVDDAVVESSEGMTVTLSSPSSEARIITGSASGTITDNDTPLAEFSISSATDEEDNRLTFTVTRSVVTNTSVSVSYATADGTAVSASDYVATSGTLSFNPGQTMKTFDVNTVNDNLPESTETFSVVLSGPSSGATITTGTGVGTILNDKDAGFSIADASATEGAPLEYVVTRTGDTTDNGSVQYATSNGTAVAGTDYTSASGNLPFSAGQTSKIISVTTTDDSATEASETLTMTLTNPGKGAVLIDGLATGTINDND